MKLVIDNREVPVGPEFSLSFYVGNEGPVPVLYRHGKRVTKAWRLEMAAGQQADDAGANANTE